MGAYETTYVEYRGSVTRAWRRRVAGLLAVAIVAGAAVVARTVPQPQVVWLILVDDLHIQFTATGYLRQLLKAIATDVIQGDEEFAIAVSSGSVDGLARIRDRDRLSSFARDVSARALRPTDVVGPTRIATSGEMELREQMMLRVASRMLDSVSGEQVGRCALIVVSTDGRQGHKDFRFKRWPPTRRGLPFHSSPSIHSDSSSVESRTRLSIPV